MAKHNEEIVFMQLQRLHADDDNKWHSCYYVQESFPVIDGKIPYPKMVRYGDSPVSIEREFTLAEFKAAITAAITGKK